MPDTVIELILPECVGSFHSDTSLLKLMLNKKSFKKIVQSQDCHKFSILLRSKPGSLCLVWSQLSEMAVAYFHNYSTLITNVFSNMDTFKSNHFHFGKNENSSNLALSSHMPFDRRPKKY